LREKHEWPFCAKHAGLWDAVEAAVTPLGWQLLLRKFPVAADLKTTSKSCPPYAAPQRPVSGRGRRDRDRGIIADAERAILKRVDL